MEKSITRLQIFITLILFVGLFLSTYFVITGNPYKKSEAKHEVLEYLIQQGKYSKDDILKIVGHHEMLVTNSACHYGAEVIFRNEPNITHYYVFCPPSKVEYQGKMGQSE